MTAAGVPRSFLRFRASEILPKSTVAEAARLYASAASIHEKERMSESMLSEFLDMLEFAHKMLEKHQDDCTTYANQFRLIKQIEKKIDNNIHRKTEG